MPARLRIAEEVQLSADERSDRFYALLMKDAGCSSNSARVSQLFGGDDQNAKRGLWERDWRKWSQRIAYALEYTEPDGSPLERLRRFGTLALAGPSSQRELFEIRCDRGASIARALGVSEPTAVAIRAMDEHWDGGGYPTGLRRDEIPLYARIVGLAQVVEIYWRRGGVGAALEVARQRRGRWFDPALVRACCSLGPDDRVWSDLHSEPLSDAIATAEPIERAIPADESRLDRIARAFALVIDAKSAFTYDTPTVWRRFRKPSRWTWAYQHLSASACAVPRCFTISASCRCRTGSSTSPGSWTRTNGRS